MRVFTALIAFALAACATPQTPPPSVDGAAERYVRLALEIDTYEEGYVDAYFGPADWRDAARANPRSVEQLNAAADAVLEELRAAAASDNGAETAQQRRVRSLQAAVASARFRLDMIDGARLPFVEEAETLFALRPEIQPLSAYEPVLARIEALVPGDGPLSERVEAFRANYTIPAERLQAVMDRAIAECRARTAAHYALPEGESFRMEFVTGQSWSAYNWYQGGNQSLIQVNTDLPVTIDRALGLACHEGYPGHHVQGIYNERNYRERGWIEYSVAPLYHPQAPLNEGGANLGVDLAFPGDQRLVFERDVLYPLAGLDPASAAAFDALRGATADLAGARLTIAQMYLDGEISRAEAEALSQRYQLVSPARAAQLLDFTEQYRAYVINYVSGEALIRDYVARNAGADADARWSAFETALSEPTLPEDLRR